MLVVILKILNKQILIIEKKGKTKKQKRKILQNSKRPQV